MKQAESSGISRRRLLGIAGLSAGATLLPRRRFFAAEDGIVARIVNTAGLNVGFAEAGPTNGRAEQIAKTYGLDSFSQIDAIRYTFNAEGALTVSRTWVWEPKTDQVSYDGKDRAGRPVKVTYLRSQLGNQAAVVRDEIDPAFINDQYWLVFPFHLVWDSNAKVEETGMQKLPLGKGSAVRVVVTYPAAGGYAPGDTWELFVGADNRIQEWVYHHGGSPQWTGLWSWEQHKKAGPLLVSLNHPGRRDGKQVRVFFSDVAVKLSGAANTWAKAQ